MEQFILVFIFFFIAMLFMLGALQFSKYKQREDSCCTGSNCSSTSSDTNDANKVCSKSKEIENKFLVDIDKLKL